MAKKEELTPNSSVVVDGIEIKTYKREITSCNIIEVEVGTTGHMGGDAGHGGRTYLKIRNLSSTDMRPKAYSDNYGHNRVEIVLGGDTELDTFYEALCFAVEVLGHETAGVDYCEPQISHKESQQINFAMYINELCEYYRQNHTLSGKGKIREKYHVTDISVQQFFECELNKAEGYVPQDFCNEVYAYVLDTTKAIAAPKYNE